jgi:thiamine kinase-like enzyme
MDAKRIIQSLALWPEMPQLERIPAGYTNLSFRVRSAGRDYFARVGEDLPWHGISRENEARCARLAAAAGIAPEVLHSEGGVLVTPFIAGRSLKAGVRPDRRTLEGIARLLADVHRQAAPPEAADAGLVRSCRAYLERLEGRRLSPAEERKIGAILDGAPALGGESFVHGDAFPENFIDDGRRLWLVDWEYAGRGHPAADLAYAATTFDLGKSDLQTFVAAHGGAVDTETVEALLPVAAARDLLWCLCESEARGLTKALERYSEICCRRLGIAPSRRQAPGAD